MIKRLVLLLLSLAILPVPVFAQQTTVAPQATPPAQQPAPPKTHLKLGQLAPEFVLTDTEGKPVKLSDFKGKQNVVLAFYVLAFTGG
jgi:cytochrome oxidase Cu insertion factor (SCO1/SenC/PrrC family)